jgi:hypothetical protein
MGESNFLKTHPKHNTIVAYPFLGKSARDLPRAYPDVDVPLHRK